MVAKTFQDIGDVIAQYSGLSRKVLDWAQSQKKLMDAAKQQSITPDQWGDVLAPYADVENFRRIGAQKEEMSFPEFVQFMSQWAPTAEWEGSFKRITEHDSVVFLELEERVTASGHKTAVNSISVYEFNDSGKLKHLDVYLQMAPTS